MNLKEKGFNLFEDILRGGFCLASMREYLNPLKQIPAAKVERLMKCRYQERAVEIENQKAITGFPLE
jgi:hypothetical protein